MTLRTCLTCRRWRILAKWHCDTLHPVAQKDFAMARYLLIAALMIAVSAPALAAKGSRGAPDRCRIVNIAPHYTQTKIRKGKRVYVTREIAQQDMAIICKD